MVTVFDCAVAFQQLLDIKYEFHLAHRKCVHRLNLSFSASEFMHLSGLHKLNDIKQLRRCHKRAAIFHEVLSNPNIENTLAKSSHYCSLQQRLVPLVGLESLLDSDNLVFRYNANAVSYSKIKADYIINAKIGEEEAFLFLVLNEIEKASCCSIFLKERNDYTRQQLKYSIMLKRKVRCSDGKVLFEYRYPKYQCQIT